MVALIPFVTVLLVAGAFGAAANIGAWGTTLPAARVAFGLPVELVVALGRVARQGDGRQDAIVREAMRLRGVRE